MKTIYIKPEEEIISIVDQLFQAGDDEINLAIPSGAQIWQSSINLKLLKREADNLDKQVALVVSGDLEKEIAERAGFIVKKEKSFPTETIAENENIEVSKQPTEPEIEIATQKDFKDLEGKLESEPYQVSERDGSIFSTLADELKNDAAAGPATDKTDDTATDAMQKMTDIVKPDNMEKTKIFSGNLPGKKLFNKTKSFFDARKQQETHQEIYQEPQKEVHKIEVEQEPVMRQELNQIEQNQQNQGKTKFGWSKILMSLIGIGLVAAAIVSYIILPTTEITVYPKSEKNNFTLQVIGSDDVSRVDEEENKIPLREIEIIETKTKEFNATGEKELNEKARGKIIVYNEYSSSPQTLVATTRFESPDGRIFRIMESVTIPGAQIVENKIVASTFEIEVVADEAGEDYNIGPTNFTIPGFEGSPKFVGFYGKSEEAMSGGANKKIKVVSEDDINQAEEQVSESLKNQIENSFNDQIPEGFALVEESVEQDIIILSDIEEETEAEDFEVEIKAVMRGFLYKEDDLRKLAEAKAISELPEDKILVGEKPTVKQEDITFDDSTKEVLFLLSAEANMAVNIDIESLKRDLLGKKETEVRRYFAEHPSVQTAEVSFWPFWVKRVPKSEDKIKITIK